MPEFRASAGAATSRAAIAMEVYALLILVAAGLVGGRILTAPDSFAASDRSRWATVRALVDTSSYSVGYREQHADGTFRDSGIVTDRGWETVDIVMDPATHRFYSTKPTLLPTLVAGEYWALRAVRHLSIARNRLVIVRTILITINLLPFLLYLLVFARLAERFGVTMWGRLFVFTAACAGTFVSGFLAIFNNHTVAAVAVLFAIDQCLRIDADEDRRWWRFVLAGLFTGWTVCNELPAATLACGVMVWLASISLRDTLRLALPALLVPIAALLFTQYLAVGTALPTYALNDWYDFAGNYFATAGGIDAADEPKLVYAANLLVGHTGILSLTPVLLLGWIGMVRMARRDHDTRAERSSLGRLGWLTLALSVFTFVFYAVRTRNYGGETSGPRWLFWLVPLWLLTMLPEADRWATDRRWRLVALALLAVSIATASYSLMGNPCESSWLLKLFRHFGLVSY